MDATLMQARLLFTLQRKSHLFWRSPSFHARTDVRKHFSLSLPTGAFFLFTHTSPFSKQFSLIAEDIS